MNDGTQKSAGQNTGTNRIAIHEEKPEAEEKPRVYSRNATGRFVAFFRGGQRR
jgi:hypothetical protein